MDTNNVVASVAIIVAIVVAATVTDLGRQSKGFTPSSACCGNKLAGVIGCMDNCKDCDDCPKGGCACKMCGCTLGTCRPVAGD